MQHLSKVEKTFLTTNTKLLLTTLPLSLSEDQVSPLAVGPDGKQDLKLSSSLVFSETANDEVRYEDLVRLRVVSEHLPLW